MSKYVNEIIRDIKSNPEFWERSDQWGLRKKGSNITVDNFGNGSIWFGLWFTSIVNVKFDGVPTMGKSWLDCFRLEQTFKWWMKNASVNMLENRNHKQ